MLTTYNNKKEMSTSLLINELHFIAFIKYAFMGRTKRNHLLWQKKKGFFFKLKKKYILAERSNQGEKKSKILMTKMDIFVLQLILCL